MMVTQTPSTLGKPTTATEKQPVTQRASLSDLRHGEELVALLGRADLFEEPSTSKREAVRISFTGRILVQPCPSPAGMSYPPAILVQGCDLSHYGISFEHTKTLSQTKAILFFETSCGWTNGMLTHLPWTRYTSSGPYHTGGHFVPVSNVPIPAILPVQADH